MNQVFRCRNSAHISVGEFSDHINEKKHQVNEQPCYLLWPSNIPSHPPHPACLVFKHRKDIAMCSEEWELSLLSKRLFVVLNQLGELLESMENKCNFMITEIPVRMYHNKTTHSCIVHQLSTMKWIDKKEYRTKPYGDNTIHDRVQVAAIKIWAETNDTIPKDIRHKFPQPLSYQILCLNFPFEQMNYINDKASPSTQNGISDAYSLNPLMLSYAMCLIW